MARSPKAEVKDNRLESARIVGRGEGEAVGAAIVSVLSMAGAVLGVVGEGSEGDGDIGVQPEVVRVITRLRRNTLKLK
jgi:hypothetical protein